MRIEVHHDDGHVYGYERDPAEAFKWTLSIDGRPLKSEVDGRDVIWQMAVLVTEGTQKGGQA